ncbi:DUF6223 family protein [Glycomyces albidus]|uniref:Uncharacterized protein n=1 Tax=Glycomyces albidus TaxID=2656774 RepID=A0A6L5G7Q8_9ACTN|nr:DUF6223 family protein [Glycomyces albidus]MQM25608.1 hypothetical protein [Glycomyces albidus]
MFRTRASKAAITLPLVLVGAAVVLALTAAPAAAGNAVAAGGYDIQDRGPSIAADLVALVSVGAGVLAMTRGRSGRGGGRVAAAVAIAAGVIGIGIAAVALAVADGGPGTGNGVVGSGLAIVLGLVGLSLGLAANRTRRAARAGDAD